MQHLENNNKTLENMLREIQEKNAMKQDFIAPTSELQFRTIENLDDRVHGKNTSQIIMEANHGDKTQILNVNDLCFDQIAYKNGLDTRTARRLQQDYPREYDQLTNAIWEKEPCKRMIRTYDNPNNLYSNHTGTARAFLSDKFKTFDNSDLLESALPTLADSNASWKIVNYANTDKKLYIR